MERKEIMRRSIMGIMLFLILELFVIIIPRPVQAATPVEVKKTWVKSGSYRVKRDGRSWKLYYKKPGKKTHTISHVQHAVAAGNTIYYSKSNFSSGNYNADSITIYSCNMKTGKKKSICTPRNSIIFLGYYKGYVYYTAGNYVDVNTYKRNVKTGKTYRVGALANAGGAGQYKNYLVVRAVCGDPSPTKLWIYNMSNGKLVKTISGCIGANIVSGKLYYSLLQKTSNNKHVLTVYRSSITGKNAKKLLKYKNAVAYAIPRLGSKYGYFSYDGKNIKIYYSSGKKVSVSDKEVSNFDRGISNVPG